MTIKRNKFIHIHAMVVFVLMISPASFVWAAPGSVTDSLKGTLDKIVDVLNDPSLKTSGKENERKNTLLKLVKERFDEEAFARRALGVWQKQAIFQEKTSPTSMKR